MMAFFMFMKSFFKILFISSIIGMYNFDSEDWFVLTNPSNILSITEDAFEIYFLSENGIFTYNYMDDSIYYNVEMSVNLPKNVFDIHYNKSNDFFYLFSKDKIFFRSSVASTWSERSYFSLNLPKYNIIDNIGFSGNYIIFEIDNEILFFDSFSMIRIENLSNDFEILWLKSSNLDKYLLSQYYSLENVRIENNYILDETKVQHFLNCYYFDRNNDLWFGMNTGAIYKVEDYSYNLKRIDIGPRIDHVSGTYRDDASNWYFYDVYFRRTGNYNMPSNGYFLSVYNENENSWYHLPKNTNLLVQNSIINNMIRYQNFLIFATLEGLLIYDLNTEKWYHEYNFLNANDKSIWKIFNSGNEFYFATSNGLIIADLVTVDGVPSFVYQKLLLSQNEIYDIEYHKNDLFVCSFLGIFKYNIINQSLNLINDGLFSDIELNINHLFALNERLWKIKKKKKKIVSNNVDFFKFSDNYVISANRKGRIKIINLNDYEEWIMKLNFNIDNVYSLDSDDKWLWVTSSDGLFFFNWSKYE